MGPGNQGHVRYPLYNAYKNETLKKKMSKEGKNHGKNTPQITTHKKMRRNKK
jgi:hypothetical protein